jgi:cellulose synthase operon protein C
VPRAVFALALVFASYGAAAYGADPKITFVPKQNRVSLREMRISDKAKDKYHEAEQRLQKQDSAKDLDKVRRLLEQAVELAPDYSAAWNALGVLAADSATAETDFRRALESDADNIDAVLNLGGLLLKTGRAEDALGFNRHAAMVLTGYAAAQAQLGMNLYQLGKFSEAERYLLDAKRINPELDTMPQLFLAEIYARRGEKTRAAAEIEELLARNPGAELVATLRGVMAKLQ